MPSEQKQSVELARQSAILIRSLLREASVTDHLVFPEGQAVISSARVLDRLDNFTPDAVNADKALAILRNGLAEEAKPKAHPSFRQSFLREVIGEAIEVLATPAPDKALMPEAAVGECEYRKTATIKARQWWKMGDHPAVTMCSDVTEAIKLGHDVPWIDGLEGGHVVSPGDWIATGIQGEHWPIKPDVFAATYAPVERDELTDEQTWPECLDPNAAHNRRTTPTPVEAPEKGATGDLVDEFRGGNEHLRDCIRALIALNDKGALVPHGIGGHARTMLAAAYHRLDATNAGQVDAYSSGTSDFSIDERDDDMLIAERDWRFGWRCIARRPKLVTNTEWRPTAERIVSALKANGDAS